MHSTGQSKPHIGIYGAVGIYRKGRNILIGSLYERIVYDLISVHKKNRQNLPLNLTFALQKAEKRRIFAGSKNCT